MRVIVVDNYKKMSEKAAIMVASQIVLKPDSILGLATGDTPLGMYEELIKMYNNNEIDFSQVKSFNLDEYYGLNKNNTQSYNYYMRENLFKHINMKEENINIPDGTAKDIQAECKNYEKRISEQGGIDLQILGIGVNGHIGFNEPGIDFEAETHFVNLDEKTIKSNSRFFNSIEEVPTKAISMGIKTIINSKRIVLLACGESKAEAIFRTMKGKINPKTPASILQLHSDVTLIIDKEAASKL
ncbi:glucosamine-6-phosphate deaminase [Clostridium tetanomorphum]|uniref:Glucosamine-6-phosphate deaminase n=1 Tax=Clostridium tetanomorphum TaxID=1553 RepID=A0A923J1A0_CLOTT|nr:glucosamine-6-phosphate deaminase [Clostridium tetanomorphum]KAJ49512.1 glucosamine-6-phosphate deaminase [Clostridium tetanomorphum DSM 665]KAJ53026.1 glucosamine-6-phosphate deaminase [Clostridium tetanomorphum DSM 665]MBC2398559.1 glucosamine-6-phosphate deaminase [Clostridium tetanomorphum]MBP1864969.1 glucosamine-6-phosphate deaminase [Clostridium tetanomorphum]NRS83175.1 glucosamine-6-phosphate deaminase [Clostridium tetanomorphum]